MIKKKNDLVRGVYKPIYYPLVNIQKAMENHNVIAGKINYFYGHFQ